MRAYEVERRTIGGFGEERAGLAAREEKESRDPLPISTGASRDSALLLHLVSTRSAEQR